MTHRHSGSALLVTVILSTIVLGLGLGLSRLVAKDIQFTSDILFAERAYFGAESGVEVALLSLKQEPVQNVEGYQFRVGSAQVSLDIQNLKDQTQFSLAPSQTAKLRLRKDTDSTLGTSLQSIPALSLSLVGGEHTQWKILCQKAGKTVSLQGVLGAGNYADFFGVSGTYDNEAGGTSVQTFHNLRDGVLTQTEQKTCFLSLKNLDTQKTEIVLGSTELLAPERAVVQAVGRSGGRQKLVQFFYAQKNLNPVFDISLFHTEEGL